MRPSEPLVVEQLEASAAAQCSRNQLGGLPSRFSKITPNWSSADRKSPVRRSTSARSWPRSESACPISCWARASIHARAPWGRSRIQAITSGASRTLSRSAPSWPLVLAGARGPTWSASLVSLVAHGPIMRHSKFEIVLSKAIPSDYVRGLRRSLAGTTKVCCGLGERQVPIRLSEETVGRPIFLAAGTTANRL